MHLTVSSNIEYILDGETYYTVYYLIVYYSTFSILFYCMLFYVILFLSILFYSIIFHFILLYSIIAFTILAYTILSTSLLYDQSNFYHNLKNVIPLNFMKHLAPFHLSTDKWNIEHTTAYHPQNHASY